MEVVLVNSIDEAIGVMDKMKAHELGLLHRAFSIFVFNSRGELLLHQRAAHKYHSGGLWTNTCCSHPLPDEDVLLAANRRLHEEMGLKCDLKKLFSFIYRADVGNGLIEHELDHVFFGETKNQPSPNPEEVSDFRWMDISELNEQLESSPEDYTVWFRMVWPRVQQEIFDVKAGNQ